MADDARGTMAAEKQGPWDFTEVGMGWQRKRLRSLALGLLCLVAPFQSAIALDPDKAISQYVHSVWRTEDGLPQNSVVKILETSDGYLWVGTQAGLARFDGVNFKVFDRTNTPSLRDDYISDLEEDTQGTLWIGTSNGGVSFVRNGVLSHLDAIGDRGGLCLSAAADGGIWIGGVGGLKKIKNGRLVKAYMKADGLSGDVVRRLAAGKDGSLWIATDGGLNRIAGGRIMSYPISAAGEMMHVGSDDSLWVQTQDAGVMHQVQGSFQPWRVSGATDPIFHKMLETRDGSLWFGSASDGLVRVRGQQVSRFTTKDGLSSDEVTALYEDRDGNLWVGTNGGGLDRFRDGSFTTYAKEEGLSGDRPYAVMEDSAGDIWVTTAAGLNRIRGNDVRVFTTAEGLSTNSTWALSEDQKQDLWIGTSNKGLIRMNQGRLLPVPSARKQIPSYIVSDILEDSAHQIWVASRGGGLMRDAKGRVDLYSKKHGLLSDHVFALAEDGKGTLWIGTISGLNSIQSGRIKSHALGALSDAWVVTLFFDSRNTLWIGTLGRGLFRMENGRFTRYTTRQGLPDDAINSILEDAGENLWIGSNKGIFRISRDELDEVAAGNRKTMQPMLYGAADGMKSSETNAGTQPSAWRARDGRLWFPTIRGVVVVDPAKLSFSDRQPPARVDQLLADGADLNLIGPIRLAPGTRRLEIHYTAPSLSNPKRTKFRYRLEGFDEQWVLSGPQRIAQYTNLPPGRYTFHVAASAENGLWGAKESSLVFDLDPRFYQTWWFQLLVLMAALALLWGIYRLRVNWLHAVLDERQRIAGEIHDTLAQGLSAIVFQTEAALLRMEGTQIATRGHVSSARDLAMSSLEEARSSVWKLSPSRLDEKSLLESLSIVAQQLACGRVDTLNIHSSGAAWPMPPDAEHQVVLVTQEALSNAIQHGNARTISIALTYSDDALQLAVSDDGIGFDSHAVETPGRGYGLMNMRHRAVQMGALLDVASETGRGTKVLLHVPRGNAFARLWRRLSVKHGRRDR